MDAVASSTSSLLHLYFRLLTETSFRFRPHLQLRCLVPVPCRRLSVPGKIHPPIPRVLSCVTDSGVVTEISPPWSIKRMTVVMREEES